MASLKHLLDHSDELKESGEFSRARRCLEEGLAGLPPQHPDAATLRVALAGVLLKVGEILQAAVHVEAAVEIRSSFFGTDHRHTQETLCIFGFVLSKMGDFLGAIEAFRQAHTSLETTLGASHPETLKVLRFLGVALFEQELFPEAFETIERARSTCMEVLGPHHPETEASNYCYQKCLDMSAQATFLLQHEFQRV